MSAILNPYDLGPGDEPGFNPYGPEFAPFAPYTPWVWAEPTPAPAPMSIPSVLVTSYMEDEMGMRDVAPADVPEPALLFLLGAAALARRFRR